MTNTLIDYSLKASCVQPKREAMEGSWGFRGFLIFIALLIVGFIAWLIWAAVEFAPTVEKDIAQSLLASPLFQRGDFAISNQPSRCRALSEVKANIPAALYEAFQTANRTDTGTLKLHAFQTEKRILDASMTPSQWYLALKRPVMGISNIGVVDTLALVCLELHATKSRGMWVTLEHTGADYWRMIRNETAWEEFNEKQEEVPELTQPSLD